MRLFLAVLTHDYSSTIGSLRDAWNGELSALPTSPLARPLADPRDVWVARWNHAEASSHATIREPNGDCSSARTEARTHGRTLASIEVHRPQRFPLRRAFTSPPSPIADGRQITSARRLTVNHSPFRAERQDQGRRARPPRPGLTRTPVPGRRSTRTPWRWRDEDQADRDGDYPQTERSGASLIGQRSLLLASATWPPPPKVRDEARPSSWTGSGSSTAMTASDPLRIPSGDVSSISGTSCTPEPAGL